MERIKKFWQDETGIVATEYVVLGAVVIGAIVGAAGLLGGFGTFFTNLGALVTGAAGEVTNPF